MLTLTTDYGLWAWKLKGNDATGASDVPAAEFVIALGALDGGVMMQSSARCFMS
jgi:hypothetical protein